MRNVYKMLNTMLNYFTSLFKKSLVLIIIFICVSSCSSVSKFWGKWKGNENKDFDKLVTIEEVEIMKTPVNSEEPKKKTKPKKSKVKKPVIEKKPTNKTSKKQSKKTVKKTKPSKQKIKKGELAKKKQVNSDKPPVEEQPQQEEKKKPKVVIHEDIIKKSPFRVGQKTKIAVSYLNMTAGYLTLETKRIVKVNGRLSYNFSARVQSRKAFSFIYSVDDKADTYVDIENLRPYSLEFLAKETKKIKESKTFFDWSKKRATYWSRKVKKGRKPSESKKTWKIIEGSQNFVSALFYLRTIDFSKNKTFSFPLADEGKNIVLKGRVVKKEWLNTEYGKIEAWQVEPKFHIKGSLTPVGRVRIWFKADKYQEIVKLDTKLRFGSVVGEIIR